ncbi:MAG: radical SAM protein [Rickettsiales bacterium]|nr:radical SAM protein [Rickettsiales bacterium]
MKKVLFSHSYFYRFDEKQWKMAEPYPPLMTITAAALLRNHKYDVRLFDVGLRQSEQEVEEVLHSYKPDYFVIFDDGFNYLTKMCLTTMREAAFRMQNRASEMGITVITCSSDSTDHLEKYLANGADYVLKGEGELTLLELLEAKNSHDDIIGVKGVAYLDNDEVKSTAPRVANSNLDDLPMAAWDLIDMEPYKRVWLDKKDTYYLNIATTRGCPYKCNWCAKPIYGQRYNVRSVSKVVDEIEFHVKNHQVNHFWMCDDIFGLKPGWVQNFRDEIKSRGLQIKYKIQSRADLLLQEDNIQALVDSGLDEVWIGAESGSQEILDAMDKGTSIAQIKEATRLLKSKRVKVAYFIQFGYLGETKSDIQKTIDLVLEMMPENLGVSVSYPLPGTKFYNVVKEDLQKKSNWVDSDDLDMMFQNTYQKGFYKILHRYLHNRYTIKKNLILLKNVVSSPSTLRFWHLRKLASLGFNFSKAGINYLKLSRLS